jgi:frataxin
MPDTEDPQPPAEKAADGPPRQPTELTDDEYHEVADEYMELVHEKAELIQEGREDVEVEYSVSIPPPQDPPLPIPAANSVLTGWRAVNKLPANRHLCDQQAAS